MARRRRLTERQVLEVVIRQGGIVTCGNCREPFTAETIRTAERDHVLPVALGGSDHVKNQLYLCTHCHGLKTREDVGKIAKADRQKLHHETGRSSKSKPKKIPSRPLQSRGFQGHRKFSGEVVWK